MIPFKVRSTLKQYVPLKPIKRGIKVWVRTDSKNGYFCEFIVYTGKAADGMTRELSLGEKVVLRLPESLAGLNHHVFCDRFFTSVSLFSALLHRKIYACETVNTSRRYYPDELKKVELLDSGDFIFRQAGNITATAWRDKKVVHALSNMSDPDASHPVRRKQDGSTKMVDCPSFIATYNNYMGGVDKGDQLRSYYHVRLK